MRSHNSQEVQYGFGQFGSIHVRGTTAVTCDIPSRVFVAIQFLEDTKFNVAAAGLTPEVAQLYPSSNGTSTEIDGTSNTGIVTDGEVFPKGITIYGRWTGFQLLTGGCIAYLGS